MFSVPVVEVGWGRIVFKFPQDVSIARTVRGRSRRGGGVTSDLQTRQEVRLILGGDESQQVYFSFLDAFHGTVMLCVGTARGELWLSSWRRTQRRGRRGGWGGESYTFALISVLRPGLHFGFGCGRGLFLVLVFDT